MERFQQKLKREQMGLRGEMTGNSKGLDGKIVIVFFNKNDQIKGWGEEMVEDKIRGRERSDLSSSARYFG